MSNYGNMKARIENELQRSDLSAEVSNAVQSAIQHYETEQFHFNQERASSIMVSGQQGYALPADFVEDDYIKIIWNQNFYPCIKVPWPYIEDLLYSENYKSLPKYYAIYDDSLWFYPIPEQTYSMCLSYVKELGTLTASTDTNSWMTIAEELVRMRAKADLLENVIRGPEAHQESARYRLREAESLHRLKSRYHGQVGSGRLRRRGLL